MTNKVKKVKMTKKVMTNEVKLSKKSKKCLSNQIDVMLDWKDVMENNPTFDQVYDYISATYSTWGYKLDMKDEYDRKFIKMICNLYKVSK
jgi:hypothetical protein